MKKDDQCKKRCQYARDVGILGYGCVGSCVYHVVAEETRAASRKAAMKMYVMAGAAAILGIVCAILLEVYRG